MWLSSAWLCPGQSYWQRHLWTCCSGILKKTRNPSSPPGSVGMAMVKLASSVAPPTSPRIGGSVPVSLPDCLIGLGVLPHPSTVFTHSVLLFKSYALFKPSLVFYCNYGLSLNSWVSCKGDLLLWVIFLSLPFCACKEYLLSLFHVPGTWDTEWVDGKLPRAWGTYFLSGRRVSVKKYTENFRSLPLYEFITISAIKAVLKGV